MRIGFFQFEPAFGEKERNLSKIEKQLAGVEADLVVLPELCLSGYVFLSRDETIELSDPVDGPSVRRLVELARDRNMLIVAGFAEREETDEGVRVYNSALLARPDGGIGVYRKMHLFYEETIHFDRSEEGFAVFPVNPSAGVVSAGREAGDGTIPLGILVCYDHMFPESARTLALRGARIVCHPSNLVMPEYAQLNTRVAALQNRVFWILANRTGRDERDGKSLSFTGDSRIYGPRGEILAQAEPDGEHLAVIDVDPDQALDKSVNEYNDALKDRRPEYYER